MKKLGKLRINSANVSRQPLYNDSVGFQNQGQPRAFRIQMFFELLEALDKTIVESLVAFVLGGIGVYASELVHR